MKIAEYKCECGNHFEFVLNLNSTPFPENLKCNKCGKQAIRRFSPLPSIIHQGKAGNYKNGYSSNATKIKKT